MLLNSVGHISKRQTKEGKHRRVKWRRFLPLGWQQVIKLSQRQSNGSCHTHVRIATSQRLILQTQPSETVHRAIAVVVFTIRKTRGGRRQRSRSATGNISAVAVASRQHFCPTNAYGEDKGASCSNVDLFHSLPDPWSNNHSSLCSATSFQHLCRYGIGSATDASRPLCHEPWSTSALWR